MATRKIIKVDEDLCTGCGDCIPNCPEGALQIIDEKARLVSDLFCDGLGACVGHCPTGAMTVEEREAEPYDETTVMQNIIKHGPNTIKAHLEHLKEHGEEELYAEAVACLKEQGIAIPTLGGNGGTGEQIGGGHAATTQEEGCGGGCPGSQVVDNTEQRTVVKVSAPSDTRSSHLQTWPVQIMLVPPTAPYLNGADIVLAADCVPFAYPEFHEKFLKGRIPLVGCPKLDDSQFYIEKLTSMFKQNDIRSITCVHMEVPCCSGLVHIAKNAIAGSGKAIPFADVTVTIKGELIQN